MSMKEIIRRHHGLTLGFSLHYLTLYSVVLGLEAKNAFEFGAGFSTKVILEALGHTGGHLTSCDVRGREVCQMKPAFLARFAEQLTFLEGLSTDVTKYLEVEPLDFVLHDGAHDAPTVEKDLSFVIPKMKKNGIIFIHDTNYLYTDIMDGVNSALHNIRCEQITLPYGCGLTLIKIREDFGNGEVELTWRKKKKKK